MRRHTVAHGLHFPHGDAVGGEILRGLATKILSRCRWLSSRLTEIVDYRHRADPAPFSRILRVYRVPPRIERRFDITVFTVGQDTDTAGGPEAVCPQAQGNARRCWSHHKPGLFINLLVVCA